MGHKKKLQAPVQQALAAIFLDNAVNYTSSAFTRLT